MYIKIKELEELTTKQRINMMEAIQDNKITYYVGERFANKYTTDEDIVEVLIKN